MLRTVNAQPTLWEAILPEMCLGMPSELESVDRLLDDPAFFEPFRAHFHAALGRPSVPIETYLRLMFLKYRYRLGFEPLCREVADSISWQRFCRIPLGLSVPHSTTLMKITTRCGSSAVDGLNEALLAKAQAAKVLKTNKVRADTTVVPANVAYPTDSGLLAKGVAKMAKGIERLKGAGLASKTTSRDRTRMMRARARSIGANLRRRTGEAKDEVLAINAGMVRIAQTAVAEARQVAANARRALKRLGDAAPGKLCGIADSLELTADRSTRSPSRPTSVSVAKSPTERPGWCHCTTPTPVPSARADSASPSSSVTRPRSSTTRTASSSTTMSRSATHRMHRCSFRQSSGSPAGPSECPKPSPLTAAMARPPSANSSARSGCELLFCPPKANRVRHDALMKVDRSSSAW